jgi:hypothetical protein
LVVGFQTSGLFSSLSRLVLVDVDVLDELDELGVLLFAGSAELVELAGLLPPYSAHATSTTTSRHAYCFISTPSLD